MLHARLALGIRDQKLSERHAKRLSELGFTIVNIAPRGVSFEGTKELFEDTFKCKIRTSENVTQFENTPIIPEIIKENVDSVYFPTKPIFLGNYHKESKNVDRWI